MREIEAIDWVEYVPDHGSNRADPKPMTMQIRFLNGKRMKRYDSMVKVKFRRDGQIKSDNRDDVNEKMIRENVKEITNYKVGGIQIETADLLLEHGETQIIEEILEVIDDYSKLTAGELGNFVSPSDSQTPRTARTPAPVPGTVTTAKPRGSIEQ